MFGGKKDISKVADRDLWTRQEHALSGSGLGPEHDKQPYKPKILVDEPKDYDVEEVNRRRSEIGKIKAYHFYFEEKGLKKAGYDTDESKLIYISFEPLDADGNTVRDPQLLKPDGNNFEDSDKYRVDKFPFKRD